MNATWDEQTQYNLICSETWTISTSGSNSDESMFLGIISLTFDELSRNHNNIHSILFPTQSSVYRE